MKKATITTVLQGCKGPQGRTRLAVLIGGVAMLLLLLSELMPTGTKSAAASTAHGEDPLLLGVDIQHGTPLQRRHIQHGGTQHTDLLVGGQHDLQPGMLHGGVLQRRQCHGYGDAVIAAQSCSLGAYQIAVHKEV